MADFTFLEDMTMPIVNEKRFINKMGELCNSLIEALAKDDEESPKGELELLQHLTSCLEQGNGKTDIKQIRATIKKLKRKHERQLTPIENTKLISILKNLES